MITVDNLRFSYNKNKSVFKVFDSLNLKFEKGFNVILGPNGAGKSTLLKSIFGLLTYEGDILYYKDSILKMKKDDKIKIMSYLPQMDIDLSSLTVMEMVILGRLPELNQKISDEDLDIVMETMESLNILHLADRNFTQLSGGQKKLVFIAQTLARKPKLILLDEPINSLDLRKQLELCTLLEKIVKEQNVDIIVVLHDINLAAKYADNVVIINDEGEVFDFGNPKDVITSKMLESVYKVKADIIYDNFGAPIISPISSIE